MARTKTSSRKSKPTGDHEHYTAELSTGQLVIGMSILLMFGLACFLMGVVIGKFDPSINPELAEENQPQATGVVAAVSPARQPADPPTPVKTVAKALRVPAPELRVPRATEKMKTRPAASTAPKETVPKKIEEAKARPAPRKTEPSAPKPQPVKQDPVKSPKISVAANIPKVEAPKAIIKPLDPKPVSQEALPGGKPRSAVQVMAFATRQRADIVRRDVEKRSSYKAQVVTSASGRLFKVVVGSYADRDSAVKVRDDLKRNFGFTDCFVTKLK